MILNELVKSGPLAKVWLSAHQEKKLTKAQALGVDVGESVEAILSTEDDALPLRSSGPLMLGVVRIYSRKVGYLYDDCREARERISLAFRPGMVDLPEDQVRASKSAITIADSREFDFFDWSWTAPAPTAATAAVPAPTGAGLTAAVPTTLPRSREFGAYNFGLPRAPSIYGGSRASPSVSRHGSQDPEGSYLGSNDFSGVDLELGLDMEGEGDISLEMGRDVQAPLSREGSVFAAAASKSRESPFGSVPSIPGDITAGGFEPMDLGLDFDNLDQPVPELDRSRRETSGLSTPPPESPRPEAAVTPRTAARLAATPTTATAKPKRLRLVQADDELEIPDVPNRDNSDILGEERYIPSDPDVVRLREIAADPGAHFLPVIRVGGENMIFAGPDGLAPELAELFAFPSNVLRRGRGIEEGEDDGARAKRPRLGQGPQEEEEGEDVEIGRRQSGVPEPFDFSMGAGIGDDSFAFQQPEETELEPYFDDPLITPRSTRIIREIREPSIAPSRAESIAREIQFSSGQSDFPLAIFDSRITAAESQSQSQLSTPSKSATGSQHTTASGFSKNTSMAMGLLRKELDAIEDGERVLSFKKTAEKATKRAASSFFFELLVLGTRDCVKLSQDQSQQNAYGDIEIRGKDKLWPEGVEGQGVGA